LICTSNGDITTHYSAAELGELIEACERIVNRNIAQTPTLTLVKKTNVGHVSDMKKKVSGY